MGNYIILSLMLTLISETVMTSPLMNYNEIDRNAVSPQTQDLDSLTNSTVFSSNISHDTVSTREKEAFEGIVQFENFIAEEKAKLLSSSLDLEDLNDVNTHTRVYDIPSTLRNCSVNINYVIKSAKRGIPWALDMIDSAGKPSSGVLQKNYHFVGDFDQCMDVDTGIDFEGRYCSVAIAISKITNTTLATPLQLMLGFCFPSTCEAGDVENYINTYFQSQVDISAIALQTNCQDRHLSLTTKATLVICICSIFATLLVIGTFYDVVYKRSWLVEKERRQNTSNDHKSHTANGSTSSVSDKVYSEHAPIMDKKSQKLYSNNESAQNEKPTAFYDYCDKILMSFSTYTNTAKLFAVNQSQDSIDCIHGIRFISNTWIILLHVYAMGVGTLGNVSPFVDKSNDEWTMMAINQSAFAVDTFFAMSGLLLTFVVLKKLTKERLTPKFIGNFYLHRYLRLTPPYMLILMTYVPLFKYLSDGPFWPQDGIEVDECKDTWWTNLLYLNNLVKVSKSYDELKFRGMAREAYRAVQFTVITSRWVCMGWSWYLACDMQFYLVSPLMFVPLFYYEWKGLIAAFAFLLGNAICSGVISSAKDLMLPTTTFETLREWIPEIEDFMRYYYKKPYTRIGPFVIGVVTGFLLFKSECKALLSKLVVVLGWMAAVAIALAVIYGPHGHVSYEDRQSTEISALYNSLSRIAWGISVCWVIFACVNGYGGFVNTLLSWKPLIPLSRLSYCAYLVHPLIIKFYFYSQRKPFYMNNLNLTFVFLAAMALSYAVAFIACLVYEIPMTELEKVIRGRGKRK